MARVAAWCVRRRRLVLAGWLALLVLATAGSRVAGSAWSNSTALPGTESDTAIQLLRKVSPRVSGDVEQVVFATSGPARVTSPPVRERVDAMLVRLARLPHVTTIASPYGPAGGEQVSGDGRVAFALVTFDRQADQLSSADAQRFVRTAQSADDAGLRVAVAGQLANMSTPAPLGGTGVGVLLAGVVLLIVFGSLWATALPLVTALAALGTAIPLVGLMGHVIAVASVSTQLVLLIGLGVGVDYALFIVSRHRQSLLAGRDCGRSIVDAVATSGRAVLFAGIIVCIALVGIVALGVGFLDGPALACALGVALTMSASLTLLPAMLGFIGGRVLPRRRRAQAQPGGMLPDGPDRDGRPGFWARWAGVVRRRPAVTGLVGAALVLVLAAPFTALRLGFSDSGNDPAGTTTRQAYDLLTRGFGPGYNAPLQLVGVVRGPAQHAALGRAVAAAGRQSDVAGVTTPRLVPVAGGADVALVDVYPRHAPQDASTGSLVQHLRAETLPAAVASSGLMLDVGGPTAATVDFTRVVSAKLPLFIGVVVLLSVLLLARVFRSLVIPAVSAVMNLLSVGAAMGMLVAVFQWGWLGSVFGVSRPGPVESFVPIFLFAVLFGLSTDYQVFLVNRIHEEHLAGADDAGAVRRGLAATGGTITAAALIMVLVFGSFVLGGQRPIKEIGLFLAGGVIIDAVVIRMAVVPAVLLLARRWAWWMPGLGFPKVGAEVAPVEV